MINGNILVNNDVQKHLKFLRKMRTTNRCSIYIGDRCHIKENSLLSKIEITVFSMDGKMHCRTITHPLTIARIANGLKDLNWKI